VAKCSEKDWNGCEKIMFYALLFFWFLSGLEIMFWFGVQLAVDKKSFEKKKTLGHPLQISREDSNPLNFELCRSLDNSHSDSSITPTSRGKQTKNSFRIPIHRALYFSYFSF
jgi:hypothetical protein